MTTVAESFDLLAGEYDSWFDSPKGKMLFKAEVEAVTVLMKGLKPPFLEIGVGSGRFAESLGIEQGVDPSDALIRKARKRGVRAVKGAGEYLPYKNETFSAVFMLFTLCFVNDPIKILAEARRVLKPGGGMITGMINSRSKWGLLYSKKKSEGHPLYEHARFYTPNEIVDLMEKSGMSVEAFSSTLFRSPSDDPREEPVLNGLYGEAGFICILSRKKNVLCNGCAPMGVVDI